MNIIERTGHTIIHGDALETLRAHIPDGTVDLIFADPPYNIGKRFNGKKEHWSSEEDYLEWAYSWLDVCVSKLKPTGSLYLMAATQNMPFFDLYLRKRLTILSRIVWFYDSSGVQARKHYGSLYEPILYCVKNPKAYTFNANAILVEAKTGARRKLIDYRKPVPTVYNSRKVPGNVWEFPRVRYRMEEYEQHPSQKPIALLERIISASSNPGDLVLDPFAGTFTASLVAQQLGRRSIGIEIEEEYVGIGLRRLGLATHFQSKTLTKPAKSTKRRKARTTELGTGTLFEAVV